MLRSFRRALSSSIHQQSTMPLFFRQLFEAKSSTFTYILADTDSKEAIIIDPCEDTVDRDSSIIRELGLNLIFALNTH